MFTSHSDGNGRFALLEGRMAMNANIDSTGGSNKRAHDFLTALQTFRLAVDAIKSGYRFDDAKAEPKIKMMERAVEMLEKESDNIEVFLRSQK